ncbi:MAG: glucan biosynthesis protein [Bdellovibrionales bacterium]|nr:glucan biosynthesis protein [Bdellovibrionales bacterium]
MDVIWRSTESALLFPGCASRNRARRRDTSSIVLWLLLELLCLVLLGSAALADSTAAKPKADGTPVKPQAQQSESEAPTVDFGTVIAIARELASADYRPPATLPSHLLNLSYDHYRMIRFHRDRALWSGNALFQVEFFHPGFLYNIPVTMHELDQGVSRHIPFTSELFRFDDDAGRIVKTREDLGFAGIRITYPLHKAAVQDEVGVFLGASYFRLVSRGLNFGLSARGLAVDTAGARGEEFPYFSQLWLQKPQPQQDTLTVYALLESRSVTGAYSFVLQPGQQTVVDCTATLFFRDRNRKFGIAPLTSMFLKGEGGPRRVRDFRPETHDSDGLLIRTGRGDNQWLWRPLHNPALQVQTSQFLDVNPRGFGLLQRDRNFLSYLDVEARYHNRPSIWIEPQGDWGAGAVELIEIPTNDETNDNIVAYWVPKELAEEHLTLRYRMIVDSDGPETGLAKVVRTLVADSGIHVPANDPDADTVKRRFIVDFSSDAIAALGEDQPLTPDIAMSSGRFSEMSVFKNNDNGEWRVMFLAERPRSTAADLRLSLSLNGRRMTETWMYLWNEVER